MMRFFRFCGSKAAVKDTKMAQEVEEASTVGSANDGPNEECLVGCPVKTSYGSGEISLVKQYEGVSLAEVKLATGTVTMPSCAALASASVVGETVGTPSGRGTVRGLKIYEGVLLAVVGLTSGGESTLPADRIEVIQEEPAAEPCVEEAIEVKEAEQEEVKEAEESVVGETVGTPSGRGTVRGLKIYEGVLLAVVGLTSGGESTLPAGRIEVIQEEPAAEPCVEEAIEVKEAEQEEVKEAEEKVEAQQEAIVEVSSGGAWLPGVWCTAPTTTSDDVVVG
eukprot:CAMPEP_0204394134 /NCGR_PEP_ID=MMETSP0469-20131031/62686_1 /ASSEMBLY_ACC=CAM_ASM_000384 /TAXON_ID=2969 /ORGANISM="Oxyrrhis marina" /LENGTH=278 /DNA_ID=CAMNT_0051388243 /DNA_START=47 /DNA_END=883 /DNA_ORIENTATION=-